MTKFDFEAIERNPINTIVLYGGSMASLIYFQDSKRVIYGNSKNINYHFTKLNLPDEILLVSEDHSIHQTFENNLHFCPSLNIPKERCWFDYLQSNYEIKMIEEKPSNVRYTYTNWTWGGLGGGGNGYFLYEARRKAPENM